MGNTTKKGLKVNFFDKDDHSTLRRNGITCSYAEIFQETLNKKGNESIWDKTIEVKYDADAWAECTKRILTFFNSYDLGKANCQYFVCYLIMKLTQIKEMPDDFPPIEQTSLTKWTRAAREAATKAVFAREHKIHGRNTKKTPKSK